MDIGRPPSAPVRGQPVPWQPTGPPSGTVPGKRRKLGLGLVAAGLAVVVLCCAGAVTLAFVARDQFRSGPPGSTTIRLEAVGPAGAVPDEAAIDRAVQMLDDRARAAGLTEPSVQRAGSRQIVVRVAGVGQEEQLRALVAVGDLRFRRVLASTPESDAGTTGAPTRPTPGDVPPPSRDQVIAKLGPAYQVAESLARKLPASTRPDPAASEALLPFAALSAAELAVLPAGVRYVVPTVTCAQLLGRPVGMPGAPGERTATCGREHPPVRYLLDAAVLSSADVRTAEATADETAGWMVTVGFTPDGQQRFTELTRVASTAPEGFRQVAIVVDDVVISAPEVVGVITEEVQITGDFSRSAAEALAGQLRSGPLPVALRVVDLTSSPD
ncbi:SecDF P1 head subdomain-containing protein [Plantactinospora sp. WMMB782]|uniref:SecDF P1 head subdomain-containing protein n=1 Tax=Plantactinospora sp. WMMB782 TaxID=3404121 RepID=UPI003B948FF8